MRAAVLRRRILARLTAVWFGDELRVAEAFGHGWDEERSAWTLHTAFVDGTAPTLHHPMNRRGAEEVARKIGTSSQEAYEEKLWQPRPSDPELEAEMLSRMMVYLGVTQEQATTAMAQGPRRPDRAKIVREASGASVLTIDEDFSRAWRRTGLALDRVGRDDLFFDLGGTSFAAVQAIAKLEADHQLEFSIVDWFENPTVASLAAAKGAEETSEAAIGEAKARGQARRERRRRRRRGDDG